MNCTKIRELLCDYIYGELDRKTAAEIKDHIDGCEECRKEYELLLGMSEAVKTAGYKAPESFCASVIEKVRAEKEKEEKAKAARTKLIKRASLVAASVAVIIIAANAIIPNIAENEDVKGDEPTYNGSQRPSDSDQMQDVDLKADNIFTAKENTESSDNVLLSQSTHKNFVGVWECKLNDRKTITMEINSDLSVVVCVETRSGIKNYFDGMLYFEGGKITLSQSDGNIFCSAVIKAAIKNGELLFEIVGGSTPWSAEV